MYFAQADSRYFLHDACGVAWEAQPSDDFYYDSEEEYYEATGPRCTCDDVMPLTSNDYGAYGGVDTCMVLYGTEEVQRCCH